MFSKECLDLINHLAGCRDSTAQLNFTSGAYERLRSRPYKYALQIRSLVAGLGLALRSWALRIGPVRQPNFGFANLRFTHTQRPLPERSLCKLDPPGLPSKARRRFAAKP